MSSSSYFEGQTAIARNLLDGFRLSGDGNGFGGQPSANNNGWSSQQQDMVVGGIGSALFVGRRWDEEDDAMMQMLPRPKRLAFIEEDDANIVEDTPFAIAKPSFCREEMNDSSQAPFASAVLSNEDISSPPRSIKQRCDYTESAQKGKIMKPPRVPVHHHHSQQQQPLPESNQPKQQILLPQCPLTPMQPGPSGYQSRPLLECQTSHITYSPAPVYDKQPLIYTTIPEYGFTSKILSTHKKKKFVPTTPAKSNNFRAASRSNGKFSIGGGSNLMAKFGITQTQDISRASNCSSGYDNIDIYSPIANLLSFSEERDTQVNTKMVIKTIPLIENRFLTDFQTLSKLGEGTFGEAFKVRSRIDGQLYAVKKAKERYLGFKDREQKLSEVYRALQLTNPRHEHPQIQPNNTSSVEDADIKSVNETVNGQEQDSDDEVFFRSHCLMVYEAWEECGYLYIKSELCEKGNLNDYLVNLGKRGQHTSNKGDVNMDSNKEWWEIVSEEQVWKFLFEMSCSLKHVHDNGFVHLDVKPSNFFVRENGSLALGDFGQAIEISKIPKLKDDDVEGDSVFMAPELLQSNLSATEKISIKADIFSLGASMLEIASGINLPQNGIMWQKLRQAGEGVIRFSPSANRSLQLEQIINLMMEPDPTKRPTADELLLHPQLQSIMNSLKESSIPGGSSTEQKQFLPSKRINNVKLNKLQLDQSPIVQKFKNFPPLLSTRSVNVPLYSPCQIKNEMILISPRALLSAQKQQQHSKLQQKKKSDLSKRPYQLQGGDTCRKKRRRKSSIGSCSSSSRRRRDELSISAADYEDEEVDETGCPISLRMVGRTISFKADDVESKVINTYAQGLLAKCTTQSQAVVNNAGPLSMYGGAVDNNHQLSTSNSSKMIDLQHFGSTKQNSGPFHKSADRQSMCGMFKSAKKLQFSTGFEDDQPRTSDKVITPDDDFKINDFSPNDEGPAAPLHIFEHHGIKKKTSSNNLIFQEPKIEQVDEAMTEEEDQESSYINRMSHLETNENPNPSNSNANKTLYFGGFSLLAPASKLLGQKIQPQLQKDEGHVSSNFGSSNSFMTSIFPHQSDNVYSQQQMPLLNKIGYQFSFNENVNNASFGRFGSNNQNDCNSGSASGISTPKLFRNQSNASATVAAAQNNGSNSLGNSIGGFQLRTSGASVFDQRFSNITYCDVRASSACNIFELRDSTTSGQCQDQQLQQRSSNTSNVDSQPENRQSSKVRPFHLKASPRVLNWAQQGCQPPIAAACASDPYFQQSFVSSSNSSSQGCAVVNNFSEPSTATQDSNVHSQQEFIGFHQHSNNVKSQFALVSQGHNSDVKRNLFQI